MQSMILLAALIPAPQGPGGSTAPVVINEFIYNDSGTDDREFVELYNRSTAPVDISNWVVDSEDATSVNLAYTIPAGTMLAPGAFYVLGNTATVPNVNLDLSAAGPAGNGTDLWENGTSSLTLKDAAGNIVDTIVYISNNGLWNLALAEGDGLPGNTFSPNSNLLSLNRLIDGFDSDQNGRDFYQIPQSPGAANGVASPNFPYFDNYDALAPNSSVTEWNQSFVAGNVIDPTTLSGNNPRIRPPSPQGGNATIWHDPTGGGNVNFLNANAITMTDVVFEAYVFMEPPFDINVAGAWTADSEYWIIGVRGTADAFGHPYDMTGNLYARTRRYEPGATGIGWHYVRTISEARLYLVDFGDGGLDFRVLGSIDIVAGVNDGWQRIRLHVQGNKVVGNFGGTYGADDGVRISANTTTVEPGGVYLTYREFILNNPLWSPLTLDDVSIRPPTTGISFAGTATPTSVGTPEIDSDGLAILGSTGLRVLGRNLVPNGSLVGHLIGTSFNNPPVPVPGAPPGATLIVNQVASNLGFSDAGGEVAFPLAIPNQPALTGLTLTSQLVDVDPALMFPLPIGHSQGMGLTVGN